MFDHVNVGRTQNKGRLNDVMTDKFFTRMIIFRRIHELLVPPLFQERRFMRTGVQDYGSIEERLLFEVEKRVFFQQRFADRSPTLDEMVKCSFVGGCMLRRDSDGKSEIAKNRNLDGKKWEDDGHVGVT